MDSQHIQILIENAAQKANRELSKREEFDFFAAALSPSLEPSEHDAGLELSIKGEGWRVKTPQLEINMLLLTSTSLPVFKAETHTGSDRSLSWLISLGYQLYDLAHATLVSLPCCLTPAHHAGVTVSRSSACG